MFVEKENTLNESDSQAEYQCRKALASAGFAFGEAPATFHWSQLVNPSGDKKAAIAAYEALLDEEPENKSALEGLAFIYQTKGDQDKSLLYRRRLREVESMAIGIDTLTYPEVISYLLARTGEAESPVRVPTVYIAAHYDHYATAYDVYLSESLKYCGPELIRGQLQKSAKDRSDLSVLDIGCGTGLVAQEIQTFASAIDGVDVSQNILDIASNKNLYRNLINADYLDYLDAMPAAYDLIVAADVLNYEGDLLAPFQKIADSLEADGLFVFTVESGHKQDYLLRNTGRFQHRKNYILDIAKQTGLTVENQDDAIIRVDCGQDVESLVFTLRKAG